MSLEGPLYTFGALKMANDYKIHGTTTAQEASSTGGRIHLLRIGSIQKREEVKRWTHEFMSEETACTRFALVGVRSMLHARYW